MSGAPFVTFRELAIGDKFMFAGDDLSRAKQLLAEVRIVHRTKTHERAFESTHTDGDVSWGLVGCGDNPVVRV